MKKDKTGFLNPLIKIAGIYKITSPTGRVYIGQSWNISKRWNEHKWPKEKSRGVIKLENSIKKYGFSAHDFQVIHQLPNDVDQSIMDTYEIVYVSQFMSLGVSMLNIKEGGRGGRHSEETKQKQREWSTGRKLSNEARLKISLSKIGKNKSEQEVARIKIMNVGRKHSDETRAKMSASSPRRAMSESNKIALVAASKNPKRIQKIKDSWARKSEQEREVMLKNLKRKSI